MDANIISLWHSQDCDKNSIFSQKYRQVLWMKSCLPTVAYYGAWLGRIFKVTHQRTAPGAKWDVYDWLLIIILSVFHLLLLYFAWVVDDAKCILVTRVCLYVCVCLCVCPRPHLIMVALWNRADHYIFVLFLSSFFFLSSFLFPRLISAVGDWMSTILPHMVWP